MPCFLILLLLTACTQKAENTQNEMPIEILDNPKESIGDYLFMTEDEILSYTSGIHGSSFKSFFDTQLISYGTNSDGLRKIDIKQFQEIINLIMYRDIDN